MIELSNPGASGMEFRGRHGGWPAVRCKIRGLRRKIGNARFWIMKAVNQDLRARFGDPSQMGN
jgi:hypothetical protein